MLIVIGLSAACALAVVVGVYRGVQLARLRRRFSTVVDADAEAVRVLAAAHAQAQQRIAEAGSEAERLRQDALRMQADTAAEVRRVQQDAEQARAAAQGEQDSLRRQIDAGREQQRLLIAEVQQTVGQLEHLRAEVSSVEGNLDDLSCGLYRPQYHFDTPEKYKAALDHLYERQKAMIRDGDAASFAVAWTVGGSRRDGERMQKQYSKLLLRAFNGECDAAIAKVAWNNATRMEERIRRSFDAINQLGEVMQVSLAARYRELRLSELRLEHEQAETKREIVEEQRRIREQMKDEERAHAEAERAVAEAQAEETRFQKALDKARLQLQKSRGEEHTRLTARIAALEGELASATAKATRAKSLAEMTKAGYVYVISNIGSFGENVFKIGMTRRLDPMDRVRELGAASVPFPFDVHAMVYSEDAPALESAFHQRFRDRSLNLVNLRKEFFQVSLEELDAFAQQRGVTVALTRLAEAREYRESAAMRLARGSGPTPLPGSAETRQTLASALAHHGARKAAGGAPAGGPTAKPA